MCRWVCGDTCAIAGVGCKDAPSLVKNGVRSSPRTTATRPRIACTNTDFPEPSGPRTAHCSPLRHVQLVLWKAVLCPWRIAVFSRARNSGCRGLCFRLFKIHTLTTQTRIQPEGPIVAFSVGGWLHDQLKLSHVGDINFVRSLFRAPDNFGAENFLAVRINDETHRTEGLMSRMQACLSIQRFPFPAQVEEVLGRRVREEARRIHAPTIQEWRRDLVVGRNPV